MHTASAAWRQKAVTAGMGVSEPTRKTRPLTTVVRVIDGPAFVRHSRTISAGSGGPPSPEPAVP